MTDTRRSFLGKLAATAGALTLGRYAGAAVPATAKTWAIGMALDITFTVATKASGYIKRPFVAVYIEDAQGTTVRNLTVWLKQDRLNPRWLAELTRWTRQNTDLVSTVSSATRNPGTYAVSWDGKDDKGKVLAQGDYYVVVETAREHGPYSLVREKVTVSATTFKKAFAANNDIEAVSVSFGKA